MENLHEAAEKLIDTIKSAERRIKLKKETIQQMMGHFPELTEKYERENQDTMQAKKRLKYSLEKILMEMYQHTKNL